MKRLRACMLALLLGMSGLAAAQQLDARFSCSETRNEDGATVIYADHARIQLDDDRIDLFQWESALHRETHGFDCSIDEEDGLTLETWTEGDTPHWRVGLVNAWDARERRGYDFSRGLNCTIRLERDGDMLHIRPTCPALCGSRGNFSALSVNTRTRECRYEQ